MGAYLGQRWCRRLGIAAKRLAETQEAPIIRNITSRNVIAALAVAGFSLTGIVTLSACGDSTVGTPVPGQGQSAQRQVEREDVVNRVGEQAGQVDPGPQDGGAGNPGWYSADPGPVVAPQAALPAPAPAPAAHPVQQPVVVPPVVDPPRPPKGPFEGPGHVGDTDVLDPGQAEPPADPKGPLAGPGHVGDSDVLDPGQAAPPAGPKEPLPDGPGGPGAPDVGP